MLWQSNHFKVRHTHLNKWKSIRSILRSSTLNHDKTRQSTQWWWVEKEKKNKTCVSIYILSCVGSFVSVMSLFWYHDRGKKIAEKKTNFCLCQFMLLYKMKQHSQRDMKVNGCKKKSFFILFVSPTLFYSFNSFYI